MPVNTPLPSTRQLRYFAALVEHGHFGRAATSCHISQSAFSIAIREFETLLGAQLVDRTNRSVTITAAGQEVGALARLCLQDLETLVTTVRGMPGELTGALHLGVIPTIAPFLLPRVLPALRRQFPKLELFLYEDVTQQLHEDLLAGRLDLMLLALPYTLTGIETQTLFRDRFRLAAKRGTKLVDTENYRYSRLHEGSVLLLREGHCLRDHALEACRIRDTGKVHHFSASSLLTLVEMVDADLGVTFLPEMAEDSALLTNTQVETYPLPGDRNYRDIGLAWRRASARATEFRLLGDFIAEHRHAGLA